MIVYHGTTSRRARHLTAGTGFGKQWKHIPNETRTQ
jgi:hypothetical protein